MSYLWFAHLGPLVQPSLFTYVLHFWDHSERYIDQLLFLIQITVTVHFHPEVRCSYTSSQAVIDAHTNFGMRNCVSIYWRSVLGLISVLKKIYKLCYECSLTFLFTVLVIWKYFHTVDYLNSWSDVP